MEKLIPQIAEVVGGAAKTRRERLLSPKDFLQLTADEVDRANRYDRPLAVAMLMVDGMVMLRKAEGAEVAEERMTDTIAKIIELVRGPDRAGQLGFAEMGILMPETTLKNATAVAERLRDGVETAGDRHAHRLTLSIGVAALSPRMRDPKRFLMTGCFELRRAHSRGGNAVSVASADKVRLSIPRSAQIH